jgi:hypothetical protein
MTSRFFRARPLLLAAALLLLASPLHAIAAQNEGREALQRQRAEAMGRLSTQQRQQYFAAWRQLEQRQASQRLEQLEQSERCLVQARDVSAVETCQKRFIQGERTLRQARMRELGGRCELRLYEGLSHEDLIATFSPLFRSKAPVLADLSGFLRRGLG